MVTSYINRVDMQYTIIMAAMVKSLRSLIAAEDLLWFTRYEFIKKAYKDLPPIL